MKTIYEIVKFENDMWGARINQRFGFLGKPEKDGWRYLDSRSSEKYEWPEEYIIKYCLCESEEQAKTIAVAYYKEKTPKKLIIIESYKFDPSKEYPD